MSQNESPKRRAGIRRLVKRVEKALQGTLKPGEELRSCFWARKYVTLAFAFFIGELWYMLLSKSYYVAASDQRIFLLTGSGLSQRPKRIVFSDDLASVSFAKHRSGALSSRYTLTHKGDEKPYELRVAYRTYRQELETLISLLEAAKAGPEKSFATSYRKFS